MDEGASNLFQVTVSGPGGAKWKVIVRAVDAESAAGAVRARGHEVVGVKLAEKPKPRARMPRVSCVKCGYALGKLPVGEAGEVMCPECGVINTPELPASATVLDEIKSRRGTRMRLGCFVMALVLMALLIVGMFAKDLLQKYGLLPP